MSAVETYLARPLAATANGSTGVEPADASVAADVPTLAMIDAEGHIQAERTIPGAIAEVTRSVSPLRGARPTNPGTVGDRFTPISLTRERIAPVINLFPSVHRDFSDDDAAADSLGLPSHLRPGTRRAPARHYLSIGDSESVLEPRWDQLPPSVRPPRRAAPAAPSAAPAAAGAAAPAATGVIEGRTIHWYHPGVRRAVRGAVITIAMVLAFFIGVGIANALTPAPLPAGQSITVTPGMTLWDIARTLAGPGGDVDHVLYQLKELNQLEESVLPVGAVIELPR